MSPSTFLFAAAAMIPAMTAPAGGDLPAVQSAAMVIGLCSGGSIALPLGRGAPLPATQPCCAAKGCHAGNKRRRIDRKQ